MQNPSAVRAIAYSPDGGRVAILCQDGNLTLHDPETGECRLTCEPSELDPAVAYRKPNPDPSARSASSACFSPDGLCLVTGHYSPSIVAGEVRVWEVATGRRIRKLETPAGVTAVAISPDGGLLAAGEGFGRLRLWELATGDIIRDLSSFCECNGVAFTPDSREVVYTGGWNDEEKPASVWNLKRGAARPLDGGTSRYGVYVRCLAVSPVGQRLALGELKTTDGGLESECGCGTWERAM